MEGIESAGVSLGLGLGPCSPLGTSVLTLWTDPMHCPVAAALFQLSTAARPCYRKGHTC